MIATAKEIESLIKTKSANDLDAYYASLDYELFFYWCRHNEMKPLVVNRSGFPWNRSIKSALYANRDGRLFGTLKNAEEIAQIIG